MADQKPNVVPVLRPLLPTADCIQPYLDDIDEARWYSNDGPMVKRFEARIADALGLDAEHVVMVANGTLGLTVALQAHSIQRGALCMLPSWTFTATVAAVLAAGLTPCFVDVDYRTQALSPELIEQAMNEVDQPIGAVVPVAPFGTVIDTKAWDIWSKENNIPCIVDAAAAFDAFDQHLMPVGNNPIMISLHATKAFGIGEGGLVMTRDKGVATRIRRIINFGFEPDRHSHRIAINAKPSEYAAAVGMAALDVWPKTRAGFERGHEYYRQELEDRGIECLLPSSIVSSTCNIILPELAIPLAEVLRKNGLDCRRWWEAGCHTHPAYRSFPVVGNLPNTRWLSRSVLGIPMACDMEGDTQHHVCEVILDHISTVQSSALEPLASVSLEATSV